MVTLIWTSPRFGHPHSQRPREVTLTLIQLAKVIWKGDAHAYHLGLGISMPQTQGYPYHCNTGSFNEIQSNLAISNSVNSKSPLFRRKIECPWIYPSPLRFPGYFEARLFRTFFHFLWDFEIAGFDCTSFTENWKGRLKNWVFVSSVRILVPSGYWATYCNSKCTLHNFFQKSSFRRWIPTP